MGRRDHRGVPDADGSRRAACCLCSSAQLVLLPAGATYIAVDKSYCSLPRGRGTPTAVVLLVVVDAIVGRMKRTWNFYYINEAGNKQYIEDEVGRAIITDDLGELHGADNIVNHRISIICLYGFDL